MDAAAQYDRTVLCSGYGDENEDQAGNTVHGAMPYCITTHKCLVTL
jgi:hypothetical protein